MTAGHVFGNGSCLGTEVHDEVTCRNEARQEKEAAIISKKKTKLSELISRVKVIKDKMKDKNFKLTIDKPHLLVAYKKTKEDTTIPSGKVALIT